MKKWRFDYWGFLGTLGAWAVLGTLLAYVGGRYWAADFFANFRPLYVLYLLPLAAALAWRKQRRIAGVFFAAVALNAYEILPAWWPPAPAQPGGYSMLVLNVQQYNKQYRRTRELIEREKPDLILLMEVDYKWMQALSSLSNAWPHLLTQSRNDSYGLALWSRWPLRRSSKIRFPGEGWIPVADATCDSPAGPVRILGAHAFPPWGRESTLSRNAILSNLYSLTFENDTPTILAGDLNVTPWSRHFRGLQIGSGLTSAAAGRGWMAGWPARWPALFRFPKTHVFSGRGIQVHDLRLGDDVGSDQLPLLLRFDVAKP